ncbi:MAG: hypothetical protein HUJ90_07070, partial [Bacteroidales bacterium]|nr:hypothetical protein [Bacteroidales bacterium]
MKSLTIKNNAKSISFSDIPLADNYREFSEFVRRTLECEHCHTLHYFAYREVERFLLIICIANDAASTIEIAGCPLQDEKIETLGITAVDRFEREIAENNGIEFIGHKWTKPLRTAPDDYPFFRSDNEGFHEVGVGPIHA